MANIRPHFDNFNITEGQRVDFNPFKFDKILRSRNATAPLKQRRLVDGWHQFGVFRSRTAAVPLKRVYVILVDLREMSSAAEAFGPMKRSVSRPRQHAGGLSSILKEANAEVKLKKNNLRLTLSLLQCPFSIVIAGYKPNILEVEKACFQIIRKRECNEAPRCSKLTCSLRR